MEVPDILISDISPEEGKKIDYFYKKSKYIVIIAAPKDLSEELYKYAIM